MHVDAAVLINAFQLDNGAVLRQVPPPPQRIRSPAARQRGSSRRRAQDDKAMPRGSNIGAH